MKKIFSVITLVMMFFSNLNFISAIDLNQINLGENLSSPIIPSELKIDFTDITDQNAGKVINRWIGKENLKTRINLTGGAFFDLDTDGLEKAFTGTNILKNSFESAKQKNIDVGTLEVQPLEIVQYPDRLSIIQKSVVKLSTRNQINNYKTNIQSVINDRNDPDQILVDQKYDKYYFDKCKKDSSCSKGLTDLQIKNKISGMSLSGEREIETEEVVNYNLIPLDINNLNEVNQSGFNLNLEPSQVRISKNEINRRFQNLTIVNTIASQIRQDLIAMSGMDSNGNQMMITMTGMQVYGQTMTGYVYQESQADRERREAQERLAQQQRAERQRQAEFKQHVLSEESRADTPAKRYCLRFYTMDEQNFQSCVALKEFVDTRSAPEQQKILLNGFTIGHSWSNDFNKRVRIRTFWGRETIFRARANRTFGYGFGVRVPILIESMATDHSVTNQSPNTIMKVKASTFDMSPEQYRRVGVPESKVFRGKEFVLELQARAFVKVVLFGEDLINREINLINLLARAAGMDPSGFNLSKDFVPPFGSQNEVRIIDQTYPIPMVDLGAADLTLDFRVRAYIDGILKAQCEKVSVTANCDELTFNNTSWKNINLRAQFDRGDAAPSPIGSYSAFGIKLTDFEYIPRFNVKLGLGASIRAHIPGRGTERWSFGPYDIYTFRMDPGVGLTRHSGTSGTVNLTTNFVYDTTYGPGRSDERIRYDNLKEQWAQEEEARRQRSQMIGNTVNTGGLNPSDFVVNSGVSISTGYNLNLGNDQQGYMSYIYQQNGLTGKDIQLNSGYNSTSNLGVNLIGITNASGANNNPVGNNEYQNLTSKDEYVNSKLGELNACFESVYNEQLTNIDDTLATLKNAEKSIQDPIEKAKYTAAIKKLTEIKDLFIKKYKFILDFKVKS